MNCSPKILSGLASPMHGWRQTVRAAAVRAACYIASQVQPNADNPGPELTLTVPGAADYLSVDQTLTPPDQYLFIEENPYRYSAETGASAFCTIDNYQNVVGIELGARYIRSTNTQAEDVLFLIQNNPDLESVFFYRLEQIERATGIDLVLRPIQFRIQNNAALQNIYEPIVSIAGIPSYLSYSLVNSDLYFLNNDAVSNLSLGHFSLLKHAGIYIQNNAALATVNLRFLDVEAYAFAPNQRHTTITVSANPNLATMTLGESIVAPVFWEVPTDFSIHHNASLATFNYLATSRFGSHLTDRSTFNLSNNISLSVVNFPSGEFDHPTFQNSDITINDNFSLLSFGIYLTLSNSTFTMTGNSALLSVTARVQMEPTSTLSISGNSSLVSIDLTNSSFWPGAQLDFSNNFLFSNARTAILLACVNDPHFVTGSIDISGNPGALSGDGLSYKAILEARGVTVMT